MSAASQAVGGSTASPAAASAATALAPGDRPVVGVIGLGLIGGAIAKRLLQPGSGYAVQGYAPSARTADLARADGLTLAASVTALAQSSELIVVAGPPAMTVELVAECLTASPTALVIDVASIKGAVVDGLAELADAPHHLLSTADLQRFLPAHPLAGSEASGWAAATPTLLDDAIWAICPPAGVVGSGSAPDAAVGATALLDRWGRLFDVLGARLVCCTPSEHDAAVARTSHAPHLATAVIAAGLSSGGSAPLVAALSGGGFRDTTRIAASELEMWRQIIELNHTEVGAVLDQWIEGLQAMRAAITPAVPDDPETGPVPTPAASELAGTWNAGREAVDLVRRVRWTEQEWDSDQLPEPIWPTLLGLGREGRAVRHVRGTAGGILAQVARPTT